MQHKKKKGTITTEEAIKRGLLGKTPGEILARLKADKDPYAKTYAEKHGLDNKPPAKVVTPQRPVLPPTGRRKIDVRAGKAGQTGSVAPTPDPNADLAAAVEAWIASQQAGGGGGRSLGEDLTLSREEARLAAEEAARNRSFEAEQNKLAREFEAVQRAQQLEAERQAKMADLEAQRQATYVDLVGRDPARAVLFALGYGPEHDVFTAEAQRLGLTLKPLAGAAGAQKTTQDALSKLVGSPVSIGQYGVSGLTTPEQTARGLVQGSEESKKLLASAYQLGSTAPGAQPGVSPETLMERALAVTPTGELKFR